MKKLLAIAILAATIPCFHASAQGYDSVRRECYEHAREEAVLHAREEASSRMQEWRFRHPGAPEEWSHREYENFRAAAYGRMEEWIRHRTEECVMHRTGRH